MSAALYIHQLPACKMANAQSSSQSLSKTKVPSLRTLHTPLIAAALLIMVEQPVRTESFALAEALATRE